MKKRLEKILPSQASVKEHRVLGLFGSLLHHPGLWSWNRRSVAGGVATGLFCGLIPGPLQMIGAGIVAVIFRINFPIALLTTFYTNPLTIIPLYLVGYKIGSAALGARGEQATAPPPEWSWSAPMESVQELITWGLSLGAPLALGVFLLGTLLALTGYVAVRLVWSVYLRRAAVRRRQRGANSN